MIRLTSHGRGILYLERMTTPSFAKRPMPSGSPLPTLFEQSAHEKGFVWLDSSMASATQSHHSFVAYRPIREIVSNGLEYRVISRSSRSVHEGSVARALDYIEESVQREGLFAAGFITYEAMLSLLDVANTKPPLGIPDLHFFLYDSAVSYERLKTADGAPPRVSAAGSSSLHANMTRGEYMDRVNTVKRHIREGDIYQANLTMRFDVKSDLSATDVYRRLREINPAPYSAYMNMGATQVLSSSPERMFFRSGDFLTTSPIKGTIRRGFNPEEDEHATQRLLGSEKDRAELLMIVDLLRNDLGKIAKTGSVSVDTLVRAEKYASVIHLMSDISARIAPDLLLSQICRALLPGGSVTGAPKRRAVELLQSLEPLPRGVYTGCIGYVTREQCEFNIAIRTITCHNGVYHVQAGGGIVADSEPEAEYSEMIDKSYALMKALGVPETELACIR